MNAFLFSSAVTGPMIYAAITLGVAIPALIYVLIRASVILWLATER